MSSDGRESRLQRVLRDSYRERAAVGGMSGSLGIKRGDREKKWDARGSQGETGCRCAVDTLKS